MGLALICCGLAAASAAPQAPDNPETIVVTGERAKRSVKETPSSVAVFTRRDIEKMAAPDRLQQLLEIVPNVLQPSNRDTPIIRGQASAGVLAGLPAFLGGARPRTVVQIDGRTITFNEFANSSEGLWDVDRVEVFRSPQTTTQGANSIAGAIFITTADPTWKWEGRIRAIAGGDKRRQLSGVLSGPVAGDDLAIRIAGDLYRSHAANEMAGPIEGADLNVDDYGVARVKLLARPRALPGLRALITLSHLQSRAPQGESARRPFRERRDIPCICGYFTTRADSATTVASYQLTGALESRTTLDWGKTAYRRFAIPGFGQTRIHGRDRSLETLLEWNEKGPLSGIAGAAFQRMDLDQFIDLRVTPLGTGTFDDRQDSSGIFGEMSWRPLPRITFTGGGRYQRDRQRRLGVLHTVPDLPLDYNRTFRAFLPKVSAAYDFAGDVRIGVLAERAYNPGGVTLEPSHYAVVLFDPEYLWDYEAYARGSLFGGALNINANLFYNASRNVQRTLLLELPTPTGTVGLERVVNDPRAHASGLEVELAYNLTRTMALQASLGWLRSRVDRTTTPGDPILGKEFGGAPRFSGTLAMTWAPMRNLRLSSLIRHNSSYYFDDAATKETRIRSSTDVDARAGWDIGRVTVFGYAHNLFNEFHVTAWWAKPSDPGLEVGTNDPREVGFGLEARF